MQENKVGKQIYLSAQEIWHVGVIYIFPKGILMGNKSNGEQVLLKPVFEQAVKIITRIWPLITMLVQLVISVCLRGVVRMNIGKSGAFKWLIYNLSVHIWHRIGRSNICRRYGIAKKNGLDRT